MSPVVVDVTVAGDGHGNLEITWELEGGGPVEIAVGPTPETVDHGHPVAGVEGDHTVTLHDLGTGRHYVSVAPQGGGSAVVAAERLVPLEGAANFRDLGGYRTDDGRTRWGLVFRSDALHALTLEDVALVGRLGLRVVYDLRRDTERERMPSVELPEGDVRRVLLAIGGSTGETREITERIFAGELEAIGDDFLVEAYQNMAERDAPIFATLLTGLTDPEGLPALFHCTAGKDRTGMSAAMLLSLLGVDEHTVLEDYELSTTVYSDRRIEQMRPRFESHGVDIDRFLVDSGGMAPDVIDELRGLLVQPG